MTPLPVLEIDGARFDDLEGFWDEVSRQLIPGAEWGRNLDAFNDILRGGFGTPEDGFVLRWTNSQRSRLALGFEETVRWLERKVERCHPDNVPSVRSDLEAARASERAAGASHATRTSPCPSSCSTSPASPRATRPPPRASA
jgi:RNAse (barnase) inhibitor barstar